MIRPSRHWSNLMRWWCSWFAHLMYCLVTHRVEHLCAWGLALTSMGSLGCSRKEYPTLGGWHTGRGLGTPVRSSTSGVVPARCHCLRRSVPQSCWRGGPHLLFTPPPYQPRGVGLGKPSEDAPCATVWASPNKEEQPRYSQRAQMVPKCGLQHVLAHGPLSCRMSTAQIKGERSGQVA